MSTEKYILLGLGLLLAVTAVIITFRRGFYHPVNNKELISIWSLLGLGFVLVGITLFMT